MDAAGLLHQFREGRPDALFAQPEAGQDWEAAVFLVDKGGQLLKGDAVTGAQEGSAKPQRRRGARLWDGYIPCATQELP